MLCLSPRANLNCRVVEQGGGGKRVRGKPAMDQYYGIVLVLLYFAL